MECIQRDNWRQWVDGRCDAAKTAADVGNSEELYNIVRELGGKPRDASMYPVQDKNGKRATTPEDIAAVHAEFLRNKFSLGDFDVSDVNVAPDAPVANNLVSTAPPTESEVAAASNLQNLTRLQTMTESLLNFYKLGALP